MNGWKYAGWRFKQARMLPLHRKRDGRGDCIVHQAQVFHASTGPVEYLERRTARASARRDCNVNPTSNPLDTSPDRRQHGMIATRLTMEETIMLTEFRSLKVMRVAPA
ncbi:hypothetical protein [Mesorhizobium sp. NPDC059025]|uniref:hypothetical protein n=1 Tax=unclassified Mesorhizobium TaxID=325217 RepID=UPI0036B4AFA0